MKTYIVFTDDGPKYVKAESFHFSSYDMLTLTKTGDDEKQVSVAVFMTDKVTGIVDSNFIK